MISVAQHVTRRASPLLHQQELHLATYGTAGQEDAYVRRGLDAGGGSGPFTRAEAEVEAEVDSQTLGQEAYNSQDTLEESTSFNCHQQSADESNGDHRRRHYFKKQTSSTADLPPISHCGRWIVARLLALISATLGLVIVATLEGVSCAPFPSSNGLTSGGSDSTIDQLPMNEAKLQALKRLEASSRLLRDLLKMDNLDEPEAETLLTELFDASDLDDSKQRVATSSQQIVSSQPNQMPSTASSSSPSPSLSSSLFSSVAAATAAASSSTPVISKDAVSEPANANLLRRLRKRSGISDQRLAEIQMIRALKKQLERASKMTASETNSTGAQEAES